MSLLFLPSLTLQQRREEEEGEGVTGEGEEGCDGGCTGVRGWVREEQGGGGTEDRSGAPGQSV